MNEAFIDLDELILLCRTKHSKKFIKEAIDCYRAGVFRSCIVSTWNAVVFDFIFKLKELQLFGDKEATSCLSNFEKLRLSKDYKGLWEFESKISKYALEKFELISQIEESDIQRLFEDRSRCAHPSMTSLEEPFEATAELARYHLRSAVTHLLQRPPVQGRAAYKTILQDIRSEYFSVDVDSAVKHFQQSPLLRARSTLVKDIIIDLTMGLLTENFSEDEAKRHFSAVNAIAIIHFEYTQNSLNEKLSDIILKKVEDINLEKVINYLVNIKSWDYVSEPCQIKLKNFIKKIEFFVFDPDSHEELNCHNINIIIKAIRINFLKQAVISQFELPFRQLLHLKKFCNDVIIDEVIIPFLVERLSEANLDELLFINNKDSGFEREQIRPYLLKATKNISLKSLVLSVSNITLDEFVGNIIKEKIPKGDIKEISLSRDIMIDKLKEVGINREDEAILEKVIEELKQTTIELIKKMSFNDLLLLKIKYSFDDFLQECIKMKMIENIDQIVEDFDSSASYDLAGINTGLLLDVFSSLTESHWNTIFNAFTTNSQISCSRTCAVNFRELLNKYITIEEEHVSKNLKIFREKLNKFTDKDINNLKEVIDLHLGCTN